jgi:hypothetical protein
VRLLPADKLRASQWPSLASRRKIARAPIEAHQLAGPHPNLHLSGIQRLKNKKNHGHHHHVLSQLQRPQPHARARHARLAVHTPCHTETSSCRDSRQQGSMRAQRNGRRAKCLAAGALLEGGGRRALCCARRRQLLLHAPYVVMPRLIIHLQQTGPCVLTWQCYLAK